MKFTRFDPSAISFLSNIIAKIVLVQHFCKNHFDPTSLLKCAEIILFVGAGFSRAIAEMNLLGTMRNTLSARHSHH